MNLYFYRHSILHTLRIYLIGFMGSGKSALGRQLSGLLQTGFADLDEIFEERYHISILNFFEKYSEESFRKIERDLLLETCLLDNTVIATGGGTPCFYDNMDFIRKNGISVYLRMTSSELAGRLKFVKKKRPLLKDLDPGKFDEWVLQQLRTREVFYLQATHIFKPVQESLADLVLKLK